jgi:molybdate transport system ATP-binding protein
MLRVEGLRRAVGSFELRVDHWTVHAGEYVVLIGPSGAGKTMLLETLAGLHQPQDGRIWIDGDEVVDRPAEARGIGFVYQDCWLFPHMSVRANIDFARRYHREGDMPSPSTADLASVLHIGDLLDRKPQTLSGGERQRVALARALAIRPRLLFLDEPLGMLDPRSRDTVAAELRACHRAFGTTTIHVTHDHDEARSLGDSVTAILGGRIRQSGPAEEVFRRPATTELAYFLGCENLFEIEALPGPTPDTARIAWGETAVVVQSSMRGRVVVGIRPEEVLLDRPGAAAASDMQVARLDGTVKQIVPRGALVRIIVEAAGLAWTSLVSRSQQQACRFAVGDRVTLTLPSEAAHLIPGELPR